MTAIDNARLLAMASEPCREVFPLLRRSAEMGPLVALLAAVPALVSIELYDIDESGAQWGIQSLRVLNVITSGGAARVGVLNHFEHVPPLGLLATAASQWLLGAARPLSLVLPSYFATVALVVLAYQTALASGSHNIAFLVALFAGLHSQLLMLAQHPPPVAMSVALASASVLLWYRHWLRRKGWISWYLVASGLTLGLCLSTGGPISLVALVVLVIHAGWEVPHRAGRHGDDDDVDERVGAWREQRVAGYRLLVVLAIAFAIGTPEFFLTDARHDPGFWTHWWWDNPGPAQSRPDWMGLFDATGQMLAYIGVIFGLAAYGVFRAVRIVADPALPGTSPIVPWARLILGWTGAASIAWIITYVTGHGDSATAGTYRAFVLIPLLGLAALGFEGIRHRDATLSELALVSVLSLAIAILGSAEWWAGPFRSSVIVGRLGVLGFLLLIAGGWLMTRDQSALEFRRRWLVGTLLLTLLLVHTGSGLAALGRMRDQNNDLEPLRRQLQDMKNVERCLLISDTRPPARLIYLLHGIWPGARVSIVESWAKLPESALISLLQSDRGTKVLMSWADRAAAVPNARRLGIQPVRLFPPLYVEGRILEAFQLDQLPAR